MDETVTTPAESQNADGELDEFAFSPMETDEDKSEVMPLLGMNACR